MIRVTRLKILLWTYPQKESRTDCRSSIFILIFFPPPHSWKIGQLLGQGSFARVYLGMNESNGQMMAVKQVEI